MYSKTKLLLATLIGLMYFHSLIQFWAFFPSWNPVFKALLACCAEASWFRVTISIHDFLINFSLCLIPAYLLIRFNQDKLPLALCLAVLPSFILFNYHLFVPPFTQESYSAFFTGWFTELLLLPIAVLVLLKLVKIDGR